MEFYENEVRPERAFLVSVDTGEFDAEASMSELYELTESAGAQPVGAMIQKREKPDGATCIGSGRLEELKEVCQSQEIDLIIFDCELSPTQIRNLEFETEVRIIDRTMLILDIFASRARSREGKLQVELAQLKYLLPRLTGKGAAMSRLGGGIGTRGPGKASWRPTGGTSAEKSRSCGRSWNRCAGSVPPSAPAGRRTRCRWWPSWAIPTQASPPCSTG